MSSGESDYLRSVGPCTTCGGDGRNDIGNQCRVCAGTGRYRDAPSVGMPGAVSTFETRQAQRVAPKSYEIGSGEAIDPACKYCRDTGRVEGYGGALVCSACAYTTPTIPVVQSDERTLQDCADLFPGDRKEYPLFTGWLRYFPHAHAAAARVSHIANEQHNPGEPVHWDQSKSIGEGNELLRHLLQAGTRDADGTRHSVKALWRAAELVEREILAEIAAGTFKP